MKHRILALFGAVIIIGLIGLIGFGLFKLIHQVFTHGWLMSLLLLSVFIPILYFSRRKGTFESIIILLFLSFFATMANLSGNFIYNKPIELILSSKGTLYEQVNVSHYAPGSVAYSHSLYMKDTAGNITNIPVILIVIYRFVQYYIMLSLLAFIFDKIPVKNRSE